jgi:CIC family chloride channel protein
MQDIEAERMKSKAVHGIVYSIITKSFLGKWFIIASLIGLVSGIGAVLFYYLIQLTTGYILGGITGFIPPSPAGEPQFQIASHPNFLLIPVSTTIGGLLAGIIVYKFAPETEGHGTDEAISAFHNKDGKIRKRVPVVKAIASSLTIGSGGSGGREGPTAQIGAGFGSFIADVFKLSSKDRRIAVAVGIGAGIGSIFKSPFGGAILSGEILYSGGDIEVETFLPGFIASPIGYVIFASFTGFTPIFGNLSSYIFSEPRNLLIYALLGVICGLVSSPIPLCFTLPRSFLVQSEYLSL